MADTNEKLIGTETDFKALLAKFNNEKFRTDLVEKHDLNPETIDRSLNTYFAEMLHGYRFVCEHIPAGKLRILEVGAGLGLVSIYLNSLGHKVVALEPAGLSFNLFESTKREIWSSMGENSPKLLEKPAEQLSPEEDGLFDFSFSINVMEHIDDIETATARVVSVLKPTGISVNSCPNYIVPYEPHYAIPMVPFMPKLTRRLFAGAIEQEPEIWDSLNFINVRRVGKMAEKNNATVRFESSVLYKSFIRFEDDPEFLGRHRNGIVGYLYQFLKTTRLLALLKFLPPILSTPMVFTYRLKS